jgi:hypothetical protein
MSAADERDTSAQAARQRAMIAEIEARLAQFGRLTAQIREGLPEHHAQDLAPIEQGIGSLAQRIGALGREKGRAGEGIDLLPTEGDPWDTRSAEELMRVYEAVNAEAVAQRPSSPFVMRLGSRRALQRSPRSSNAHWPMPTRLQRSPRSIDVSTSSNDALTARLATWHPPPAAGI